MHEIGLTIAGRLKEGRGVVAADVTLRDLLLASLIPRDELLHDVIHLRNQSILISLVFLFATILIVLWLAHRISTSLRLLARGAQRIREFKLETIYNRIHEIRMRFEVLWRDAELDYHKALIHGTDAGTDPARRLHERQARIRDDFAFVARCNIGGESMSQSDRKRLARIGAQTWLRHLDDRLGISREELSRKQHQPPPELPVRDPLLADKQEHLVPRRDEGSPFGNNTQGFAMQVPEYRANHGELTNLSVVRGTLTTEERFTINSHIIQTIRMLSALPWPPGLRQVPDWAGNHHEAYCGGGYPRGLVGRKLSIPERIMVVADVFEALTAADRPYKQPRTLSEALGIMKTMCRQGHLCPVSFTLLLTPNVYRRYADAYLDPFQIDTVDEEELLTDIAEPARRPSSGLTRFAS
ncbi:hypothetical protein DSCO28_65000 [Desulfosarcina ovata subsp. sediminis]|uniref:HD-GYP domain-containing protein n=1 Tax=Desulfosarcina ovata subsp. sediminis TaxID=885957 RepID=A0A5K8A0M2_9BACT|nr:HD domain-containing phosphohydrolase [Desulfosarcina ovata]BBO85934.1 hypothetical protein DSCO28_65000 [Desulfosarcina ovata subsp. sediminis]